MLRKISNSFALAFSNIRSNLFHTFLSVLGIVIGVGALVSILSLIDGMEIVAREQISQTTSLNAIVIQSEMYRRVNDVRLRRDTITVISYKEFEALGTSLGKRVTPYMWSGSSGEGMIVSSGKKVGVNALAVAVNMERGAEIESGVPFTEATLQAAEPSAIVNKTFLKIAEIKEEHALGQEIMYKDKKLKIIAVLAGDKNPSPVIYFPVSLLTPSELLASPAEILMEAVKTEEIPVLKEEIKQWLNKNYTHAEENFRVLTNEFRVEQAAKAFLLFRIVMGLIVGISVVVGGIGVMNVLLISVTERTAEIGIRKAMGANRRDIILLFLSESITVSAFGSLLGLIFGVLATMVIIPIVRALTEMPFQAAYTWNTFTLISIIAILVGIVFGTYPAIRASRLNPVDAIRHE